MYDDFNNGKTASAIGRGVVTTISVTANFIPVVGPAVSAGIGVADAVYGEKLYDYLDKKFD